MGVAHGHDSPEHVVESLTARMTRDGCSANLLMRRAREYRSLNRLDAAAADLSLAIALEPENADSALELARVEQSRGQAQAALELLNRALTATPVPRQSSILALRGEALTALGRLDDALADFDAACRDRRDDVDLYLQRAEVQARLGRHAERLAGLEIGCRRTASMVLQIERIDALIDLGRTQEALSLIEAELHDCRWRSSWLIRRAQVCLAVGEHDTAVADLRAAVIEIGERLHPERPDAMLLADRAVAHALLGERVAAESDLASARARIIDDAVLRRAERLVHHTSSSASQIDRLAP